MAADRLSPLDSSFLGLEDESSHMHVATVLVFDGKAPSYDEFFESVERRLHLVPRYRQRVAWVPFDLSRPRWMDDPHLNLRYHVRAAALPHPGSESELRDLAGRVFSQQLDRDKPLWELWLVEGLEGGRFAVLSKTHHALIDGIAGVDLISVLFDAEPDESKAPQPDKRWLPRPKPSGAELAAEAIVENAIVPSELLRSAGGLIERPAQVAGGIWERLVGLGAMAWAGISPAPPTPYNERIGPHRRFTWVRTALADLKAIKTELGGTVNDVVLATVAGALGRHLRRRGYDTHGLELRAMVPVSLRVPGQRGDTGNQVSAMMAPLPVGVEDPRARYQTVREAMDELKTSGQALGARTLAELTGFAAPNIMSQASRLMMRQRFFNVVVTNVPGPQMPLYLLGREMRDSFPMVPLAANQGLGIAIMSYNGRMDFGLVADRDLVPDLEELADDVQDSLTELAGLAGLKLHPPRARRGKRSAKGTASARSNGGGPGAKSASRSRSASRSPKASRSGAGAGRSRSKAASRSRAASRAGSSAPSRSR